MYHVFLSHSDQDRAFARRVCESLRAKGITVFYSPDSIVPSQNWVDALIAGIAKSRCFVLLVSESSVASKWVQEEVEAAVTNDLKIVPAFLECFNLPPFNPLSVHIKYLQELNLYSEYDRGLSILCDILSDENSTSGNSGTENDHPDASPSRSNDSIPAPQEASRARKPDDQTDKRRKIAASTSLRKTHDASQTVQQSSTDHKREAVKLIDRLLKEVDRGDREAAYFLGRLYSKGYHVEKNPGRAVRYLHLAAQGPRGLPEAVHDLATKYHFGKGVGQNKTKAFSLYERAARLEYAPAIYRLGRIYQTGDLAPKNHERAVRRFRAAAQLDYAAAKFRLAEAYMMGLGVEKDEVLAFDLAIEAGEKHYPPALNLIGRFYRKGIYVDQDNTVACNWYEQAMRQGSAEGAYNLATMYTRGLGRERDELAARRCLDAASRLLAGADPRSALRDSSILVENESTDGAI